MTRLGGVSPRRILLDRRRAADREGALVEGQVTRTGDEAGPPRLHAVGAQAPRLTGSETADGLRSYRAAMAETGNTGSGERFGSARAPSLYLDYLSWVWFQRSRVGGSVRSRVVTHAHTSIGSPGGRT